MALPYLSVRQLVGLVLGLSTPDRQLCQRHVPPRLLCPSSCPTLAWIAVGFPGLSWTPKSPEALLGKSFLDFGRCY